MQGSFNERRKIAITSELKPKNVKAVVTAYIELAAAKLKKNGKFKIDEVPEHEADSNLNAIQEVLMLADAVGDLKEKKFMDFTDDSSVALSKIHLALVR